VKFVPQVMDWAKMFPPRNNRATNTTSRFMHPNGLVIEDRNDVKFAVIRDGRAALAVIVGILGCFIIK
jgi:hypothetical protein